MNSVSEMLLTPRQFAERSRGDLLLLDASPEDVYAAGHIEGARWINAALLRSHQPEAPGGVPERPQLRELFEDLGVRTDTPVVACDHSSGRDACRTVWSLHLLGFPDAAWLCGDAAQWGAAGLPIVTGADVTPVSRGALPDTPGQSQLHADAGEILASLSGEAAALQIWDCRSRAEFTGEERRTHRGGHIPGAFHLEWTDLLNPDGSGAARPTEEVRALLEAAGADLNARTIVHCHLHARSAVAWTIGRAAGLDIGAYSGSWAEWGNREDVPIEEGDGGAS
ncbi:MAG: sulfurtransferase [Gammaproteobacteria bacterium AqS3]|nr:sulfurtransferase [Gammaproteobacteria bacterium AqS3]